MSSVLAKILKRGSETMFGFPQPVSNEHDGISSKQIKITTPNSMLQSRVRAVS